MVEERERRPASGGRSAARSAATRGEARPQPQWRRSARQCIFCAENVEQIDYKDAETLSRFLSDRGKIRPRRQTGLCARHQRQLARAVKRARHLALLPFTIDYTHWG